MRRLILILVLNSGWICFSDVAAYINEEDIIVADDSIPNDSILRRKKDDIEGGQTEQDPNDPKYQKMARELVVNNLRIPLSEIKYIKVDKVTTQVVSGIITRIHLQLKLISGKLSTCQFEVWERPWENVKHVSYKCDNDGFKKTLSASSTPPRPVQLRNPKDPKYKKLAQISIDSLFKQPGSKPFKKEDIKTISIGLVKVQIGSTIMNAIQFSVTTVNNEKFECTTTILEKPWNPEEQAKVSSVNCKLIKENKKLLSSLVSPSNYGDVKYKNPDDPKYEQLAKESFEKYIKSHSDVHIQVKEFKVTEVTEQLVSGINIRIDFFVIPEDYRSFPCHSKIYKHFGSNNFEVSCVVPPPPPRDEIIYNAVTFQNPDDNKYFKMAQKSWEKFQETHIGPIVKELKVTQATYQLVNDDLYELIFYAITNDYHSIACHSEIIEPFSGIQKDIITVNCTAPTKLAALGASIGQNPVEGNSLNFGGEEYKNPDDIRYEKLATESFIEYKRHHNYPNVIKEFKVTKATKQVISGFLIKLDFYVIPTNFASFQCHSKIYEKGGTKDIKVSCETPPEYPSRPGGEKPQNPDDNKYKIMAKKSWEKYEVEKFGPIIKEFKVGRVTKQVVNGITYRIIFFAITNKYYSIKCNSKIYILRGNEDITVNCVPQTKLAAVGAGIGQNPVEVNSLNLGGEEYKNPDDIRYEKLATESFIEYKRHHNYPNVIKEFKVTKATKQVISGFLTKLDFYVIPTNFASFQCHSKIYEKGGTKDIKVSCETPPEYPSRPGGEKPQNPDNDKYKIMAKKSWEKYEREKFGPIIKEFKVGRVTKQVVNGITYRIIFFAITNKYYSIKCNSKIYILRGNEDITVNCVPQTKLAAVGAGIGQNPVEVNSLNFGGEEYKNPDDIRYAKLAKESFIEYKRHHNYPNVIKEFKVTKATKQVISGFLTKLDFYVIPTNFASFQCHSKIYEKGGTKEFKVSCETPPEYPSRPGGEKPQNPDNDKYKIMAKKSWEKYEREKFGPIIKEFKVGRVTKQVVNGITYRIIFFAITNKYYSIKCNSKIYILRGNEDITVNCVPQTKLAAVGAGIGQNPVEVNSLNFGGEEYKNPDDIRYAKLAKESFIEYKRHHNYPNVIKEFKVTKATKQVISGFLTKLDFYVIPTNFASFQCHSKIYEKGGTKDIKVSCETPPEYPSRPGGEKPQNPDNDKYKIMAKKSWEKYEREKFGPIIKEFKVGRVTKQVVNGITYRIIFFAITNKYHSIKCSSKIHMLRGNEDITVNCAPQTKLAAFGAGIGQNPVEVNSPNIGGEEYKNPDDTRYEKLAKESFIEYKRHHNYNKVVKEFKVIQATEQLVAGFIIKLIFFVIPTDFMSFKCHSEIYEMGDSKDIKISCETPPNYPSNFGGERPQNPDDYKYTKMAQDSWNKRLDPWLGFGPIKEFKVTRVTEQLVAGTIYRITFAAISHMYFSQECSSEIFQPLSGYNRYTIKCGSYVDKFPQEPWNRGNVQLSLKQNPHSKTDQFLREAISEYLQNNYYHHNSVIIDRVETKVRTITTRLSKQKITYYAIHVSAHSFDGNYSVFDCSVLTGSWFGKKPLATNCLKETYLMGRTVWVEPTIKKYLSFAEKSLQTYLNNPKVKVVGPRDYRKYDIIVTFVTEGTGTAGPVDTIVFIAHWVHDKDDDRAVMKCSTEVWEKPDGKNKFLETQCQQMPWHRNNPK